MVTKRHFIFCLLSWNLALFSWVLASDQIPAPPQKHPILLTDVTIHPVSSGVIRNGQILFDNGVVTALGRRITDLPDNTQTLSLEGKHLYPGLISASSTLGLVEINAVRSTKDFAEVGSINPNVRAEVSYNSDSELIPVARSNGITVIHTIPLGGIISGSSAAMNLDGWTWESATLKAPIALHLNWPSMTIVTGARVTRSEEEQKEERDKQLRRIDEVFDKARSYLQAKEGSERSGATQSQTDLRWESMIPVLKREVPLFIHANEVRQVTSAVQWSRRQNIKIAIAGGHDAWRVSELLKKYQVPVIYESVHSLPSRRWEGYDTPFATPWKLYKAGVQFCIATSSSPSQAPHQRNLPYHAAMAAAYGLPREEALKAVTLYPAQILGIDDRVGSLDAGKDATLVVTDGDPLEIRTQVEMVFIQGKKIDLTDRHKTLYKKYREKYRQLGLIR